MNWIEVIGLVASLIVLASFLMKDILVIRLVNIAGALVFVVYGVLINAFATWFVNAALMVVHIIYIFKELRAKKNKESVNITNTSSETVTVATVEKTDNK